MIFSNFFSSIIIIFLVILNITGCQLIPYSKKDIDLSNNNVVIDNQDPQCDLNYTANAPVARELNYAMNNAFGFGGHNSTLVFKRFQGS